MAARVVRITRSAPSGGAARWTSTPLRSSSRYEAPVSSSVTPTDRRMSHARGPSMRTAMASKTCSGESADIMSGEMDVGVPKIPSRSSVAAAR